MLTANKEMTERKIMGIAIRRFQMTFVFSEEGNTTEP